MRILIWGPSRFNKTGYGSVIRGVSPVLRGMGHEVAEWGYNGQPGQTLTVDGVTVFPRGMGDFTTLDYYIDLYGPDVVLAIGDPFVEKAVDWKRLAARTPLVFWMPVQAGPMHPGLTEIAKIAKKSLIYSEYGTKIAQMERIRAEHLPLGIDPALYDRRDRQSSREWFAESLGVDLSKRFVIGMVAANVPTQPYDRKGFSPAFMALRAMLKAEVDIGIRPLLYVHTLRGSQAGGMDLVWLARQAGVEADVAWMPDGLFYDGLTESQMSRLYSAFDVLLSPSRAEGFCLPLLEAQACGTPVVTTRHGSMKELVFLGQTAAPAQVEPCYGAAGGLVATPSVTMTAQALLEVMLEPYDEAKATEVSLKVRRHYNWESIGGRLAEHLAECCDD